MSGNAGPGTVIVSGAASGLGAAVARAVADLGGTPLGLDVAPCSGFDAETVDVSDAAAVSKAVDLLLQRHERLDAVVTAAGVDACGPLEEVAADDWARVVGVNLVGTAAVVRACLPALRRDRGRVVTIASTLGHRPAGDATAYCASKFGVVGFTRALQVELRDDVPVTLVTPGGMRTAFFDGRAEQYRPPADAHLLDPAEVAGVILRHLVSDAPVVRELVITVPDEPSWP